jgi:hypothetical protein
VILIFLFARIMRSQFVKILVSVSLGLGAGISPGQAQLTGRVTDSQVERVAEAIRQVSLSTGIKIDGLYSDWQIKPENISNWSRKCIGKDLSPQAFAADAAQSRKIVVCVLRDVLRDEYQASKNNELIAVRRTAAWWLTGVSGRYQSSDIAPYTQKVVEFYQQPNQAQPPRPNQVAQPPSSSPAANPVYDRYVKAAKAANQRSDYDTALLYFKRALDERPNDAVAMQEILAIENQRQENRPIFPLPQPTPSSKSATP